MTGRAGVVDACASGTGTALKASSGWRDGCPVERTACAVWHESGSPRSPLCVGDKRRPLELMAHFSGPPSRLAHDSWERVLRRRHVRHRPKGGGVGARPNAARARR
jgi:hypothetical protein